MRMIRLCSAGISQRGRESEPEKVEPRSVVLKVLAAKRVFRWAFHTGMPQRAQQAIRIAHGTQA